jgi:hypothetical protein
VHVACNLWVNHLSIAVRTKILLEIDDSYCCPEQRRISRRIRFEPQSTSAQADFRYHKLKPNPYFM